MRALQWVVLLLLSGSAVGAQVLSDGLLVRYTPEQTVQWVRSPAVMRRLVLGFDTLAADLYWIRAVQYYGSTKLSNAESKSYGLLYPLLDITTTLDPRFNIAYRFGAILLSEGYPNGPGQPEEAIALLEKGIRASPGKWEYFHDAGFVHYWWRQDSRAAADWWVRGSKLPGAPTWLQPLAASVLAEGGDRAASRLLWTQLAQTGEHDWMRQTARLRLQQLDAEAVIDELQPIVNRFYDDTGRFPAGWAELARAGRVRGVPLDPTGMPYDLDPVSGAVDVAPDSSLFLMRRGRTISGQNR
jgi:hypothetical protein